MTNRLQVEDLKKLSTPEDIAKLFQKLGYQATAQEIAIYDLNLRDETVCDLKRIYLISSYERNIEALQILFLVFHKGCKIKPHLQPISRAFLKRPANYLFVATSDHKANYKELVFFSPQISIKDKNSFVTTCVDISVNCADPSPSDRNWVEKFAFFEKPLPEVNRHKIIKVIPKCRSNSHGDDQNEQAIVSPKKLHRSYLKGIKEANLVAKAQKDYSRRLPDSVGLYLKEIGRFPLLKAYEEVDLAKQVYYYQILLKVRSRFSRIYEREPTDEEWLGEWLRKIEYRNVQIPKDYSLAQIISLGKQAQDRLVISNLRLVINIAKKYQTKDLGLLDLIQEGNLGLIRATEKFDYTKGYRFSTYAYWWIRQAITKYIHNDSRMIRLPVHIHERINKIRNAAEELAKQLNRLPSVEEVASQMDIDPQKIVECIDLNKMVLSLNDFVDKEKSSSLMDLIVDVERSPVKAVEQLHLAKDIRKIVFETGLLDKEISVLMLRFGLYGDEPRSLSDISKTFEYFYENPYPRERIRQIEAKALQKLRQPKRRNTLRDYLY